MSESHQDLARREAAKRDRMTDPLTHWRMICESIEWADRQAPVSRNSRQACLAEEARKLRGCERG